MKQIFTWTHIPLYFILLIVLPTLGTMLAIYLAVFEGMISWVDVLLLVVMYTITELGVTIGYHRMLVHKSFEPTFVVKFIFLIFASMAMQGPAITWASFHRKHHAYADKDGDPHSPTVRGFFYSHVAWIFSRSNAEIEETRSQFGKRFFQDKLVVFFDKSFFVWVVLPFVLCYLIGGWTGVMWGGLVRLLVTLNATWCVNSVCHLFGTRSFNTEDKSKNNLWVALATFGEGWHHNHHAFERSAFHGMKWWQIDMAGWVIWLMEKLRLIKNVYRVTDEQLAEKSL